MADWQQPMEQSFEYYTVDPRTWTDVKRLTTVKTSSLSWNTASETLATARLSIDESISECYIRIYLVVVQNGIRERYPLMTTMVQTQSTTFDGRHSTINYDGYSSLIELKEKQPPLGYALLEDANVMDNAYAVVNTNTRAPVIRNTSEKNLYSDFVSNVDDTWLTFATDLIKNAEMHFDLDEMGNIMFAPDQKLEAMQPRWTYNDDNCSIIRYDISCSRDLYGIPNVVEVYYTDQKLNKIYYSRVSNDDPNSIVSTVNRGREITHRVNNPEFPGLPNQENIDEYARQILQELSTVESTIEYTHGYNQVRIYDCVRLNIKKADLEIDKALVTSQTLSCTTSCQVDETAVFKEKLWK